MAQLPTVELKVSVTGLEPMKRLLALLHDNFESLPTPLQQMVLELASDDKNAWDVVYFEKMGLGCGDIEVTLDGEVRPSGVLAIWPDTCEAVIWGRGVTQHGHIQVKNRKTGEIVCEARK
jgi:hypothetical protein